jgi:hypothetical protein
MDLPFPNPPFASLDRSDPFATYSSHRDREWVVASAAVVTAAVCQLTLTLIFSCSQSEFESSHAHIPVPAPLSPPPSSPFTPPRLLCARASESGSIFHESVWPPPPAASQLMDPLTSPNVDLARIVTGVMGPPETDPLLLLLSLSRAGSPC